VLILVNEPEHAYLSDEGMKLLTGILAACGMSMADVGILNLTTELNLSTPTLQDLFNPSAWWIFGIDAERLQLGIMSNSEQTNSYKNVPVFWSPALKTLEGDPAAKRTLWGQLKKHYGV
jgi:DNA polymerase III psi subunit